MNDRLEEFLRDLREHWDDHYWWSKHLALQMTLLAILTGLIGLLFKWLEARVQLAVAAKGAQP